MKYYSTNRLAPLATLEEAVVKGLADDKGLYMPEYIPRLEPQAIERMKEQSFHEIACTVARAFFGEDIEPATLDRLVCDTLSFEAPVVEVKDPIYSLELFHGPTLAFKDVGGRFMARLLGYFIQREGLKEVNVLVATSGDTGSAVANGFLGVPGIHVYVLYPKGKVSPIQECQFTTLGQNITALEIDGTFDDCQALVKAAFMDMRKMIHPNAVVNVRMEGRAMPEKQVRGVQAYFSVYMLLYAVSWLLLSLNGFDLLSTFTALSACINNIGPGLGMVGPTGNFSAFAPWAKLLLSFDMLAGRLEIFPMLLLFVPSTWRGNRLRRWEKRN